MNTIGAQIPTAVHGSYPRSMTSFLIFFNKVMKIMFSDAAAKRSGQAPLFTETCFFFTITIFPILFGYVSPWLGFLILCLLLLVNALRYRVIRLNK